VVGHKFHDSILHTPIYSPERGSRNSDAGKGIVEQRATASVVVEHVGGASFPQTTSARSHVGSGWPCSVCNI